MSKLHPNIPLQAGRTSFFDRLLDKLLPLRARLRLLDQENQRLEAFLRAVPIEYCGWDADGMQAISPGFAAMFGLDKVESLNDIQAAIAAGDAAALEGLFDRLRQFGENFDIGVNTVIGKKALKLFGKQGAMNDGSQVFSVLWTYDITDFAQGAMRSMEAISAVEKRENDLRAAFNALPFAVWMRNTHLDLMWCNKFYAKVVDDTAASVIADQKELPITGTDKKTQEQRALAQKAMAASEAQSMRGHVIIEGQRRLVEMTEIPLTAEKKIIGIGLDVTHEEEWQQSHKHLTQSYREAMEQLRTAIAMFDGDMKLEFYNTSYEQLTDLQGVWLNTKPKLGDILDKMREARKIPEQVDYKQFKQGWLKQFAALMEPYEEMQYLPDDSVVRMVVVPRPQGGIVMTLEDVTSRLKLETSYNTLMAVQQETMDNLADGIVVFGEDGKVKLSNKAFASMWGLLGEDLMPTTHVSKMIDKAKNYFDDKAWAPARNILLGNGLEREPRRGRLHRKDGIVLEYSVVPLPDGNILNAYFDITDTVKVEQALTDKNNALQEAERLKTDFLANVSYQLRTPLNAMMGFAEMLQQQYFGKLNDRQLEYTGSMIEAGQRLVSLINDILDLSTIEAGYLKLYPSDINIRELMERVTTLTRDWAQKQRIEIVLECKDNSLNMLADERRIKQVLLNLISNAINYSPNGGTITLSAVRAGDAVLLGVKDTGVGIPASDLPRVFTPFERIQGKKAQRQSGAGLGLTLVRSIVELHGGEVKIDSIEGRGTTVMCRLPLRMVNADALLSEKQAV